MEFDCTYAHVFVQGRENQALVTIYLNNKPHFLWVYWCNKPIEDSSKYCSLAFFDKIHWETSDKVLFSQHGKALEAHPYAFTMYVEERQTIPKHLNHTGVQY